MALPQPKGKQLEVLDLKPEGHNVVLGTAGSGKTTLAIYRAIYLATLDDKEKVMLVTFNTTLVKYLEAIVGSEIPRNIEVRNYHKFARGYLAHRNKMPRWNSIKFKKKLSSKQWMVLWQECQLISEEKTAIGFWFKLKALFKYGVADWSVYKQDISKILTTFQAWMLFVIFR